MSDINYDKIGSNNDKFSVLFMVTIQANQSHVLLGHLHLEVMKLKKIKLELFVKSKLHASHKVVQSGSMRSLQIIFLR